MPLRNAEPKVWRPTGLSDAIDGSNAPQGAMSILGNLIPDPSTAGVFVPRPAAVRLLNPVAFLPQPQQITAGFIQSDILYGLITSAKNPGFDQPFAFNLATGQLLPVGGITPTNVPQSPQPSGDWQPPTMSALGNTIVVTHPGFLGYNGYIGWFDVTNPFVPIWHSGQMATNPFPSPPVACEQFGGRMYYAVGSAVQASDIQLPLQQTNANQVLTFGDRTPVTALGGLPMENQLGGIIQALIVFKSSNNMWQITGDYILNTWAVNAMNVATGTLAPNTIFTCTEGLGFVAPDGLRIVDFNGRIGDPIGAYGAGVTMPFIKAVAPSRMCAAFNQNVLRITVQNGATVPQSFQEYWYDFTLKIWTGPHSFPVSMIWPWRNTFIAANPIVAGA